jgi:hypothetical protein
MKRKNKGGNRDAQTSGAGVKNTKPDRSAAPKSEKKSPWERGKSKADAEGGSGGSSGQSGAKAGPHGGSKAGGSGKTQSKRGGAGRGVPQPVDSSELKKDYIVSMKHAPRLDENTPIHWIQFIPAVMFTAIAILLVKQYYYARDMSIYYWSSETAPPEPGILNLPEFFSHYKTELIGWSVLLMGVMLAYRFTVQQFAVKRTALYWPMIVYVVFTILSCVFSANRDVAWDGWNDRFEGTAMILCYYAAVFFIMNSVNSERNIKFIVYPVAAVSVILSAIGLSQATGHDFFQSTFGQKLIVANEMTRDGRMPWNLIDEAAARGEQFLKFTFQNNEIYQTVYNINYVSFYLTLLIPIFAMMFVWAKGALKKTVWGVILGLVVFNFFGAASSGGFLGIAVIVILVVVVLRMKLIRWRWSVLMIVVIVAAVGAADVALVNHNGKGVKWTDELKGTLLSSLTAPAEQSAKGPGNANLSPDVTTGGGEADAAADAASTPAVPLSRIDYFITEDNTLTFSVDGNEAVMTVGNENAVSIADSDGEPIALSQSESPPEIAIADDRFANVFLQASQDEAGNNFIVFNIRGDEARRWPFIMAGPDNSTLMYRNDLGKNVSLEKVPRFGFENRQGFGSGRGYIWSTSLPMIKDTIVIGRGADTYCIYYPHNDYVGKYNAGWNINMIVDKPHNMYIATALNTGLISLIAMLALFGMYIVQSIRLYWRREFTTFAEYAGAGIFFGVSGFVVSGIVDDSTVSVMPLFYGLLATGIATNIMLKKRYRDADVAPSGGGAEAGDA